MAQSMTGFASKIIEISLSKTEKISLSMHLKTLNARYFEITCKLPALLSHSEVNIHRILKKALERGSVYLTIKVHQDSTRHVVTPAQGMVEEYMKAIEKIRKSFKIKESVSLQNLLSLPHIFQVEEESLHAGAEEKVLKAVESLVHDLVLARQAEGKVMLADVAMHMQLLLKKLQKTKKISAQASKEKKENLNQILKQTEAVEGQQSRSIEQCLFDVQKMTLLTEIEKIDIHEEITRASLHAKNILALVKDSTQSKGKKLDFTLQELNREINTIASKCNHGQISALTIDMKSDIEKAREQAQNIL